MTSAAPARIALNCTAYDALPSGARTRSVGLAAGLLEAGADVTLYTARGATLRDDVVDEFRGSGTPGTLREVETTLVPGSPVVRAFRSERWFRRHLEPATDLFVTDYYPVVPGVRTALTVHDLRYLASPADEPRHRVAWFRTSYAHVAQRADHIVVPSAAVGSEAVFHLAVAPERVSVVPNGLARIWSESPPRQNSDGGHLLWIGTGERRKRLGLLLRAYAVAAETDELLPLVLVGRGSDPAQLPRPGRALADAGHVHALGVVSDAALVELVRDASALLHPSRYEGFGLPVLEALAVGTPVVAARIAAIVEVARGGAHLVAPDDLGKWAQAVRDVGGRNRCVVMPTAAAVQAARAATWRVAAEALLDLLRSSR